MGVWLVRAGKHGEYEEKFLEENRVYVTWDGLDVDIGSMSDRQELSEAMFTRYTDAKPKTIVNWVSQIWPFAHEVQNGDLIVLPLKSQPAINIAEVTGEYEFDSDAANPYFHWRGVRWIADSVPRSHFGQDLLYSFGAFLTICRIKRNNAEARIEAMRRRNWDPESLAAAIATPTAGDDGDAASQATDLEELGRDQIAQLISARFKGHDLTRLVEAVLQSEGYTTWRSPKGADGGADILAGAGPLGFGAPRLCVEVKSERSPIDRPSVDKLLGAVTKFGAHEGLFVSWSGFKANVHRELASSFFNVRLWSQKELLERLFANYDKLDEDLRAELPLKRIWTVAAQDED